MQLEDKTLVCQEKGCGKEFLFTAGEQEYFKDRQLTDPKRCKPCRLKKRQERELKEEGGGDSF